MEVNIMANKNVWIALILSFFVTGLGNAYNGLYKRAIVEFVISLVLGLLSGYISAWISIFALAWTLYVLFDTYDCSNAINEGKRIPLFIGNVELE